MIEGVRVVELRRIPDESGTIYLPHAPKVRRE